MFVVGSHSGTALPPPTFSFARERRRVGEIKEGACLGEFLCGLARRVVRYAGVVVVSRVVLG